MIQDLEGHALRVLEERVAEHTRSVMVESGNSTINWSDVARHLEQVANRKFTINEVWTPGFKSANILSPAITLIATPKPWSELQFKSANILSLAWSEC